MSNITLRNVLREKHRRPEKSKKGKNKTKKKKEHTRKPNQKQNWNIVMPYYSVNISTVFHETV